tara:strand:+ start:454 stop:1278 length:825 start_codon:yes stop_codon:yes gene_type:complete
MKNNKLEIFCVTNKQLPFLEKTKYHLAGVGKDSFNKAYIESNTGENIIYKEQYYSELVFHYWFWKNELKKFDDQCWIGFCQKRRFWLSQKNIAINNENDLLSNLLVEAPDAWQDYDSIICESINVDAAKKMKIIKRGWKNLIQNPSVFFSKKEQTVELHFDMHHGYKVLDKAIQVMNNNDKSDFKKFVSTSSKFNPHIMFITKKKIMNKWFEDLFQWLFDCEKIFGFKNLVGYDQQRIYAFLSERYLSFWFNKYTKSKEWPWIFFDHEETNEDS